MQAKLGDKVKYPTKFNKPLLAVRPDSDRRCDGCVADGDILVCFNLSRFCNSSEGEPVIFIEQISTN